MILDKGEDKSASFNIKKTLLKLSDAELEERREALRLYLFYKGKSKYAENEIINRDPYLLGQSWKTDDKLDYKPNQTISNKVRVKIKKQARWMFGKTPDITINADEINDTTRDLCEDLRRYLENILNDQFWKETKAAFLEATIKKRVACRVAAIPKDKYLKIRYDKIDDLSYVEIDGNVVEVNYFAEDLGNAYKENNEEKLYYIYTYYYKNIEGEEGAITKKPFFSKKTYKGCDLENPIKESEEELKNNNYELGFECNRIPCWIIKNNPSMEEVYGESDVEDLIDIQNERNRKLSDFSDALSFGMFGSIDIVDGSKETVNELITAPGAIHAITTADDRENQAKISRSEYSLSCSSAVIEYLNLLDSDMNDILDQPNVKDLTNIPSAKALKYLNNDLIDRCEDKWSDWQPFLLELIDYILHISNEMNLPGWNKAFNDLIDKCTISFKHNYPIPEDESTEKEVGLKEVDAGVRSKRSYIKKYSEEEDMERAYNEILEEKSLETDISMGSLGNTSNNNNNSNSEEEK